jgi:predicted transcriptional regulator
MTNRPAGTQELRFLQFIAQHGPLTVGQVAEQLGDELGLARSTVLTVMERLRQKRHLRRRREAGVFLYSSALSYEEVMQSAVGQFVDRALSGSISPFVAYLSERSDVSADELDDLRRIVARLESRQEPGK